jgi:KaiC/GvpD/RAD55 family RecA-like ATPase
MPFAVLGRYPLYSSCVQKDFASILSGSVASGVLDRMAGAPRLVPSSEGIEGKPMAFSIPLDPAQERIVASLWESDGLVVQGPPGTGKSQVIAEMAVSAITRGTNVLVVSEKKAALDVVRSRLGPISDYCMLIDDAGDKASFYSQLSKMLSLPDVCEDPGLEAAEEEVGKRLHALDRISGSLYEEQESGMLPIRLYSEDLARRLSGKAVPAAIEENVPASAKTQSYEEAARMHSLFSDPSAMQSYLRYREAIRKHPVLLAMKEGLTPKDLGSLEADLLRISASWDGRPSCRMEAEREAYSVLGRFFDGVGPGLLGTVLKDPGAVISSLESYGAYSEGSRMFGALDPAWKSYGNGVLEASYALGAGLSESEEAMFALVEAEQARIFDEGFDASVLESFEDALGEADKAMDALRSAVRASAISSLDASLRPIKDSRRFGDMSRIMSSKRRWSPGRFVRRFGYEMLEGVRIWLMTPDALSDVLPLEAGMFGLLIFDEASQMFVERGVPAMQRARRVAVAGDRRQLRPSAVGFARYEDSEGGSLLDVAAARFPSSMLDYHYRSRFGALMAFSNRAFYGGRLHVAPDVDIPRRPPIEVRRVDGTWEGRVNVREAEEAVKVLREVLEGDETVGVITFNSHQRDLVMDMLEAECASDPAFGRRVAAESRRTSGGEDVGLFVKNVENVQGDERDVIIFSVGYGRDPDGRFAQRFGWLNAEGGENRLNVAITRARSRMVLIRSFDPGDIRSDEGGPGLFKSFLRYADAVSSGDSAAAMEVLDSVGPAVAERQGGGVCAAASLAEAALRRAGFGVEHGVGTEGCVLDLAAVRDGRRVLGIEVDAEVYADGGDSRSRDCLRRRYLESRGWKVVRLWTAMMWRDSERECARIVREATESWMIMQKGINHQNDTKL